MKIKCHPTLKHYDKQNLKFFKESCFSSKTSTKTSLSLIQYFQAHYHLFKSLNFTQQATQMYHSNNSVFSIVNLKERFVKVTL